MTDLLFIVIAVASFAVCVGYVRLCDRIIGPDPAPRELADAVEPAASGQLEKFAS